MHLAIAVTHTPSHPLPAALPICLHPILGEGSLSCTFPWLLSPLALAGLGKWKEPQEDTQRESS